MTIPSDGRLTSQSTLTGTMAGSEVMYIVSPGTEAAGSSYQVALSTLAGYFAVFPLLNPTTITSGATALDPYDVLVTDTRILFNKTVGAASYALMPLSSTMTYPFGVLIKDYKGDAPTNNITVTFSGGELCDGQSEVVIDSFYGWATLFPRPDGTGWYQA